MRSDAADGSVARAARRGQAGGTAAMSEARRRPERAGPPGSSRDAWGEQSRRAGAHNPPPATGAACALVERKGGAL